MVCLNCGCQNEEGAVVCAVCGASLSSAGNMGVYPEAGSVNVVYQAGAGNTAVNTTAKEQPLAEMPENRHDVFISYSTKNKNVADAIVANFEQNGIRCWYAPRDIMPGQEWVSAIKEGLKAATVFVLIYTDESNQSRQVMNEVALAFNGGKTIVPFRLTESQMNDELEYYLTRVHWMDALSSDLSSNIDDLRRHVATILHKPDASGAGSMETQAGGNDTGVSSGVGKSAAGSSAGAGSSGSGKKSSGDSGKKKWLIPAIVAAVAVAAVVGVIIALSGKKDKKPDKGGSDVVVSTEGGTDSTDSTESTTDIADASADELISKGIEAYYNSLGGTEDREKAQELFEKAAEMGSADAYYYLGNIKYDIYDYSGAAETYNKGIELNSDLCRIRLAIMNYDGYLDTFDLDEVKRLNDEASENGAVEAEYFKGMISQYGLYGESVNGNDALKYYSDVAEKSKDPVFASWGYRKTGDIYKNGCGEIKSNYSWAIDNYKKAAEINKQRYGFCYLLAARVYKLMDDPEEENCDKIAFEYIVQQEKAGRMEANYFLGQIYQYGYGTESNGAETIRYFSVDADAGDWDSMVKLGDIYSKGIGDIKKNSETAYKWYEKAANAGDKDAMNLIGNLYYNGEYGAGDNGEADYNKARIWYEKAASKGSSNAMVNLGDLYYFGKGDGITQSYEEAEKLYLEAFTKGSSYAAYRLGYMYYHGESGKEDKDAALKYYIYAAEGGNKSAMMELADIYDKGEYGEVNKEEAFKYYRLAAEDGNEKAMYIVGYRYRNGDGTEKDDSKAFEYYLRSANQGYSAAMYVVAGMYRDGAGVDQNYDEARKWAQSGAEAGDSSSMYLLAMMDKNGEGISEPDAKSAAEWYKKVISSDTASNNVRQEAEKQYVSIMAELYETDSEMIEGIKECYNCDDRTALLKIGAIYSYWRNYQKTEEYYLRAVDAGSNMAMAVLGDLYAGEYLGAPDYSKAMEWFNKAADSGDKNVIDHVKESVKKLVDEGKISREDAARWLDDETSEGTSGESSEEATEESTQS